MILFKKCIRVTANSYGINIRVNGYTFGNYSCMYIHKNVPKPVAVHYRATPAGKRKLRNVKVTLRFSYMKTKLGLRYEAGKKCVDLHVESDGVWAIYNGKYIDIIPFERRCIIL